MKLALIVWAVEIGIFFITGFILVALDPFSDLYDFFIDKIIPRTGTNCS
jgi:hypothetical protein